MKYISVDEYLQGRAKLEDLPDETISNINTLIPKINDLLEKFGEYRKVNSGYRTIEDQKRINPKSMKSRHLTGQAIDISDENGKFQKWILNNIKIIEELDLYFEDFSYTKNWVHCQIIKPKSGKRFFIP